MDPSHDSTPPQIVYPCIWVYAVIGVSEQRLRSEIAEAIGKREHKLRFSRLSDGGRYCSFHLETRVENEAERNEIYQRLKSRPNVRMVL